MPMTVELKTTILNTGLPKTMYPGLLDANNVELCRAAVNFDTVNNGAATHSASVNWPVATQTIGKPAKIILFKASTGTAAWTTSDPITFDITPPEDGTIDANQFAHAAPGSIVIGL